MNKTEKLNGIVLRSTPYRENGWILTLLTDVHGKIAVLARGVRRNRKASALYAEPFAYSGYSVLFGRGLPVCDSAELIEPFYGVRASLDALSLGQYFLAVASTLPENVPEPGVLRLLLNSLSLLSSARLSPERIKLVYEVRFSQLSGFAPEGYACSECGKPATRFCPGKGLLCDACAGTEGFTVTENEQKILNHILRYDGADSYRFRATGDEVRYLSQLMQTNLSHELAMPFPQLSFYGKYNS